MTNAKDFLAAIMANVDDFYSNRVTYETFTARAKDLHAAAASAGHGSELRDLLRRQLP